MTSSHKHNPFPPNVEDVFDLGAADGFLTRVAGTTLLNVTAGGGSTVPTFVLHE